MEKVKVRISLNLILILICLAAILGLIYFSYSQLKPVYSWKVGNFIFTFRANLKEAQKVPVYPSSEEIRSVFFNPNVKNVSIVFKDAGNENSYYEVEGFEIAFKLTLFYKINGLDVKINSFEIDSYEEIEGSEENPIIALVHPKFSNETCIILKNNVVYIKAKDLKDFDLATSKFLISVMEIKI